MYERKRPTPQKQGASCLSEVWDPGQYPSKGESQAAAFAPPYHKKDEISFFFLSSFSICCLFILIEA